MDRTVRNCVRQRGPDLSVEGYESLSKAAIKNWKTECDSMCVCVCDYDDDDSLQSERKWNRSSDRRKGSWDYI